MPDLRFTISTHKVRRDLMNGDNIAVSSEVDAGSFLATLGSRVPLETGLIPPGLLSIRQAGDHMQLVMITPPGAQLINWGEHEGDRNAKTYLLAMPYRVIIGEFLGGTLAGARMFYSPTYITSTEQPLYMVNLPNTNQKGYRGTGVGWVCLYSVDDMRGWSLGRKAARLLERCSGVETYNDHNMSETDGTRFYRDLNKPQYLWDPTIWEEKTENEGWEWALDPDLWITTKVAGIDNQDRYADNGQILTLQMAMTGSTGVQYHDSYFPKPINGLARPDLNIPAQVALQKVYNDAFMVSPPAIDKVIATTDADDVCISCTKPKKSIQPWNINPYLNLGLCLECGNKNHAICYTCKIGGLKTEMSIRSGRYWCKSCLDQHKAKQTMLLKKVASNK